MNDTSRPYPIGTPGVAWGEREKTAWLARQTRKRSYPADVLSRVEKLGADFDVVEYGRLDFDPGRYPLMALKTAPWRDDMPVVVVTGGVHGYETSGVMGALRFLEQHAAQFEDRINLLVAPCVSPWAWETIQRWNMHAIDPNRSFGNRTAQESTALLQLVEPLGERVLLHVDLHETTDTDESEFSPALAARDGKAFEPGVIPEGFYVVDDTEHPRTEFQTAVIDEVSKVTQIADADAEGKIIGSPVVARGVIQYELKKLGLCGSITDAPFKTTTEVYPDSPRTNPEECIAAQVTAVCAAIEFAVRQG